MNREFCSISDTEIERLKENYPDSEYIPGNNSPDWLTKLALISKEDIGVQILLGPVGVNLNLQAGGSRLKPEASSVFLAGLTGKARSGKGKISVGLPPFGRDLSLFLACISVLNKIIERGEKTKASNRGVLVVSSDLRIRSLYSDLLIKNEPLDIAFPGSRMLPNGKIQPLGKSVHKIYSGVCFFLPHRRKLPNSISIQPDIILLDLRYGKLCSKVEDLVNWTVGLKPASGIIALYTIGDRISRFALNNANFSDFPLDHLGLQTCKNNVKTGKRRIPNFSIDINLMNAVNVLSRQHVLNAVSSSADFKDSIINLVKLFEEQDKNDHQEINTLRWLFSVYTQMPVPLAWYENTARGRGRWVPCNVIKRIGSNTRDIGKLGPVLQTFRAHFRCLNSLYERNNPKAEELKKLILSISIKLSDKDRLLIVVRDEVMENALLSWLTLSEFMGKDWVLYIDVIACKKYMQYANQKYKYFISTGPIHFKYRWILGGDIGQHLYFLVYPHEADIVKNQIEQFYDHKILDMRAGRRQKIIGVSGYNKVKKETLRYPKLDIIGFEKIDQNKPVIKKKLKEKVKSFDDLWVSFNDQEELNKQDKEEIVIETHSACEDIVEETDLEEEVSQRSLSEISSFAHDTEGVRCFTLSVSSKERGKGQIWIDENAHVEFIRPNESMELLRRGPEQLKAGDLLLIVDENQQSGIFERMIEIADSSPRIQYLVVYRNIWRKAINLLAAKYQDNGKVDYTAMYKALQNEGIKITTIQTLKNWINDVVIGPDDISSINAVGRTSGIIEMSKNAKEFDRNFEDIRSLHRSIGRKVASIIRKMFKIVVREKELDVDEQLQEYWDLPLNEIINAIEIVEVLESRPPDKEGIAPSLVGKFITLE